MPLDECARVMKRHDIGSVIVGTDSIFIGLVTEQHLVHTVIAHGDDPAQLTVADVMLTDVVTVSPDVELSEAMRTMTRRGVRHLPVLDGTTLVGFLTVKDLLEIQPTLIEIFAERERLQEE